MEVNRYLIVALYVMAGCVVTVPLNVEGRVLPLDRGVYRLLTSDTVKIVSAYTPIRHAEPVNFAGWLPDNLYFPEITVTNCCFSSSENTLSETTSVFSRSNQIRAPELN